MIHCLVGWKKNVGDFLIAERAMDTVRATTGEKVIPIDRWKPLDTATVERINSGRGLVLCGGPLYAPDFHPRELPLARPLEQIEVPMLPIGIGAAGTFNIGALERTDYFDAPSRDLLERMHNRVQRSGVRDPLTFRLLRANGFENVTLSGCPALFDERELDGTFEPPGQIRRIVVTPPAHRRFYAQYVSTCRALRRMFPAAWIVASFHRGLSADVHTRWRAMLAQRAMAAAGLVGWGIEPRDTAYDTGRLAFYRDMDLHVGYRVHAHVFFQAMHKPSLLIQEDSRGVGMSQTLKLDAWDVPASTTDVPATVRRTLGRHMDRAFEAFEHVPALIRSYHRVTTQILEGTFG